MGIIGISGKINSGKDTVGEIVQIISASPHFTDEAIVRFLGRPQLHPLWENKKFADKLKDMACMLLGCTRGQLEDREFKEKELGPEWDFYQPEKFGVKGFVLDANVSYDEKLYRGLVKQKMTPRLLMQLLGTECGRQIIHPNIWVNALMSEYKGVQATFIDQNLPLKYHGESFLGVTEEDEISHGRVGLLYPNWIITDVRFPNELKAVKDREGITIRVNRPCNICGGSGYHKMSCPVSKSGEHCSETALDNAEFDYTIDNNGTLLDLVSKVRKIMLKERLW